MGHKTMIHRLALALVLCGAILAPGPRAAETSSLDQVLDEIVRREQGLLGRLQGYRPLVETYLQSVRMTGGLGAVAVRDRYFLGRLRLDGDEANGGKSKRKSKAKLLDVYEYSAASNPDGFARMLTLDGASFDRENYHFEFVRREFLGEIRTLVFEIVPKKIKGAKPGRFTGRIWVDDRDYNIVRFNGVYGSIFRSNLHFDSWRINVGPGLWLPAYVYTEEPEGAGGNPKIRHRGQTRIWGYDVRQRNADEEFTKVLVEAPLTRDDSEQPGQISPVESFRAWEREAEDNVLRRLHRAGLLAPEGEVNEVLETVVANIEVTNDLDIYPPVRCRVLLTTPLESFTVGHTIVLSRGLVDVLPDEASLAMVLATELAHIVEGHRLDTRYAFSDQMLVDDGEALDRFVFERRPEEVQAADARAVLLLRNSPYGSDLENAGLFLKALSSKSQALATLIEPHFGNRIATRERLENLAPIVDAAPALDPSALEQVAALPLGGRVKVDPWTARIELMRNNRVALMSAREKMPFQITPLMPHLVRFESAGDRTDAERAATAVPEGADDATVSAAAAVGTPSDDPK
jgi:hypothetical protein